MHTWIEIALIIQVDHRVVEICRYNTFYCFKFWFEIYFSSCTKVTEYLGFISRLDYGKRYFQFWRLLELYRFSIVNPADNIVNNNHRTRKNSQSSVRFLRWRVARNSSRAVAPRRACRVRGRSQSLICLATSRVVAPTANCSSGLRPGTTYAFIDR